MDTRIEIFSDEIWKIDAETGGASFLTSLSEESGKELDVTEAFLDVSEKNLFFIDKNSLTLWKLTL